MCSARLKGRGQRYTPVIGAITAAAIGVCGTIPASAAAVEPSSHLTIQAHQFPTHFREADEAGCAVWVEGGSEVDEETPCDSFQVTVSNPAPLPVSGPIVVRDTLPAGVSEIGTRFYWATNPVEELGILPNETGGGALIGTFPFKEFPAACTVEGSPETVSCSFGGPEQEEIYGHKAQLSIDNRLKLEIHVTAKGALAGAQNRASVYVAGVLQASSEAPDSLGDELPPFGANDFLAPVAASDGQPDQQAGDHPAGLTTTLITNTIMQLNPESTFVEPMGVTPVRDVVVDLPPGFLGSAIAAPKCTYAQLQIAVTSCPKDTRIGHLSTGPTGNDDVNSSLYNMEPKEGHVAEFGFTDILKHTHSIVATIAPTPQGYVARAIAREIPTFRWRLSSATSSATPRRPTKTNCRRCRCSRTPRTAVASRSRRSSTWIAGRPRAPSTPMARPNPKARAGRRRPTNPRR